MHHYSFTALHWHNLTQWRSCGVVSDKVQLIPPYLSWPQSGLHFLNASSATAANGIIIIIIIIITWYYYYYYYYYYYSIYKAQSFVQNTNRKAQTKRLAASSKQYSNFYLFRSSFQNAGGTASTRLLIRLQSLGWTAGKAHTSSMKHFTVHIQHVWLRWPTWCEAFHVTVFIWSVSRLFIWSPRPCCVTQILDQTETILFDKNFRWGCREFPRVLQVRRNPGVLQVFQVCGHPE